ncbi:glycosyltransferase family 2 protein [Brachyspira alvinipulli]|uniref:glycosyltransferase family 2 protein n=1 Tax=Brachyspira alvinipulli TaxID=84379 RepID=UPI0004AD814C|nr:glycosyltransferase family 2 protein [Brachyspira alvinipulli]
MSLFSIIIPVYNTEKYISKCLNSLVNQTFKDIEIIVVNDCSTDNSKQIIESYKEKDNRIIYIENEVNSGPLVARKNGTLKSSSKYVTYIDSDDELELNTFEEVVNILQDKEYDVIHFDMLAITDDKKQKKEIERYSSTKLSVIDENYLFNEILLVNIASTICAKIFKREIMVEAFKYIKDKKCVFSEDMLQGVIAFYFAKSYKAIDKKLYKYRCNVSVSNKSSDELSLDKYQTICSDLRYSLDTLYNFLCSIKKDKLYYYEFLFLSYRHYEFIKNKIDKNNSDYIEVLNSYFSQDFIDEYNECVLKNKYYLNKKEKLEKINKKLLPYFFSVIVNGYNTSIRLFGINVNLQNNKCYYEPLVITISNILRGLFSIQEEKENNIKKVFIRILGLKIRIK